jgi:GNAT superfamily N-acetyltransferase
MATEQAVLSGLEFYPLTRERWSDFEELFGPRGACGGCWCMWWRLKRSEFETQKGQGNRNAIKAIVESGEVPGILAYLQGKLVAWCPVAPREHYSALQRSRILKPVDETPVWSVVCFFVIKGRRRKGITPRLLRAAVEYVKQQGGRVVEGYPVEPRREPMPDASAYTGLAATFLKAGFTEVLRRSETRPIMRFHIQEEKT